MPKIRNEGFARESVLLCAGFFFVWLSVASMVSFQLTWVGAGGLSAWVFAVCAVMSCSAVMIAFAFNFLPAFLYRDRSLAGCGAACSLLCALLVASGASGELLDATVQVVAGLFFGTQCAAGYLLWADGLSESAVSRYASIVCVAAGAAIAVAAVCMIGPWVCWALFLCSGVGAFALRLVFPSLRNLVRMRESADVQSARPTLSRCFGSSAALACVFGYVVHHFATHVPAGAPNAVAPWQVYVACCAGILVFLVLLRGIQFTRKEKSSGAFVVLTGYPIAMVLTFVPLDYLDAFMPNFQAQFVFASGSALIMLLLAVSHEVSKIVDCKPVASDAVVVSGSFLGALAGSLANAVVGASAESLLWAVAPVICLVAGIWICEFLYTRSAIVRLAPKESSDDAMVEDIIKKDGGTRDACMLLARDRGLTSREADVLFMLVQGYSLARVSELLHIAEGTAATHKRHVYKKLGVHTKNELIDLAQGQKGK